MVNGGFAFLFVLLSPCWCVVPRQDAVKLGRDAAREVALPPRKEALQPRFGELCVPNRCEN
eukprot:scaffold39580_cov244-Amphora_coffeaeformis.AAC.2